MSNTGYLMVSLGVLFAYLGVIQLLVNVHTVGATLAWGAAVGAGVVLLGVGTARVMRGGRRESAADPNEALRKVDPRFGRR